MKKEIDIKQLVNIFLSWPLPASVNPDNCVHDSKYPHRCGTNLLTSIEAEEMFEYVLGIYNKGT